MARNINATGRNTKQSFIMLRHDIFDSAAWKSLKPPAKCVWLQVTRRYNGINNGNISLSCLEAAKAIGISKNTANKSFKDLVAAGFLKVGIPSGFSMKTRRATRWVLTHERLNTSPPSNEWRQRSKELAKIDNGHISIPPQSSDEYAKPNYKDYSPA